MAMPSRMVGQFGQTRFGLACCMLALLCATGCARNATLVVSRAAQTPVVGGGRVAVMRFEGHDRYGPRVQAAVLEQVERSGLVPLVDGQQLQQYSPWPLYLAEGGLQREAALEAGRRLGLDTLLVGNVQLLEADGSELGTKSFRIGDPAVRAVIGYSLLDVRSGRTIFDGQVESSSYTGDLSTGRSKAEIKILEKLCDEASARLAQRLVPSQTTLTVPLASTMSGKGAGKIRQGNKAAQRGDWATAAGHWLAAIDENPASHAALHNLALAHVARQDFATADRCITAALAQSDQTRYQQARDRIRQAAGDQQLVLAQRSRAAGAGRQWAAGPGAGAGAGAGAVVPAGYQPAAPHAAQVPPPQR